MPQVNEDHNAQTAAKQREQRILAGPPPTGIGRRCPICKENKWKREFYAHMDKHLDLMNSVSNEDEDIDIIKVLELESSKSATSKA